MNELYSLRHRCMPVNHSCMSVDIKLIQNYKYMVIAVFMASGSSHVPKGPQKLHRCSCRSSIVKCSVKSTFVLKAAKHSLRGSRTLNTVPRIVAT